MFHVKHHVLCHSQLLGACALSPHCTRGRRGVWITSRWAPSRCAGPSRYSPSTPPCALPRQKRSVGAGNSYDPGGGATVMFHVKHHRSGCGPRGRYRLCRPTERSRSVDGHLCATPHCSPYPAVALSSHTSAAKRNVLSMPLAGGCSWTHPRSDSSAVLGFVSAGGPVTPNPIPTEGRWSHALGPGRARRFT